MNDIITKKTGNELENQGLTSKLKIIHFSTKDYRLPNSRTSRFRIAQHNSTK